VTDYYLDISNEVCPLTFVKTKLMIERMSSGDEAEVLIRGAEPVVNVPRSVRELGHEILSLDPDESTPGNWRLRLRKA